MYNITIHVYFVFIRSEPQWFTCGTTGVSASTLVTKITERMDNIEFVHEFAPTVYRTNC